MAKIKLNVYEYCIVHRPKAEDKEDQILVQPVHILAPTEDTVKQIAIARIGQNYQQIIAAGEVEVLVRPFR